ncbi:hypothetical protein QJS66_11255 [Kocuria rhizophila]|nr:hypothetical protein QJS66_11255 [Kocuria rhizophila]
MRADLEGSSDLGIITKHVLLNPPWCSWRWPTCSSTPCAYAPSRAPTYLAEHHGTSRHRASPASPCSSSPDLGTLACGWVSDKAFRGNRSWTGIVFMLGVGVFLVADRLAPAGTPSGCSRRSCLHRRVHLRP